MTAEVAVMNKQAVALAADSAITFSHDTGQKIFPSANKIFALSEHNPVGIMIYGDPNIMGVPWETVIKAYRNQLGETEHGTISAYAENFFGFLKRDELYLSDKATAYQIADFIYSYCRIIKQDISAKMNSVVENMVAHDKVFKQNEMIQVTVDELIPEIINDHSARWERAEFISDEAKNILHGGLYQYQSLIREQINIHFPDLPEPLAEKMENIVYNYFTKYPEGFNYMGTSGIVISGFGKDDVFPVVEAFWVDGKFGGFLKYTRVQGQSDHVTLEANAVILTFAQPDMVDNFMTGISAQIGKTVELNLRALTRLYPGSLVKKFTQLSTDKRQELQKLSKNLLEDMVGEIRADIQQKSQDYYVKPIMQVVQMLPKGELAIMAEALVNLTSFKRRVSAETETVSGPIDVAVISKDDGFVWIKRKQYFDRLLNE